MQLLELWPIAKLVLKQIVKAHGPLVPTFYWGVPIARWIPLRGYKLPFLSPTTENGIL